MLLRSKYTIVFFFNPIYLKNAWGKFSQSAFYTLVMNEKKIVEGIAGARWNCAPMTMHLSHYFDLNFTGVSKHMVATLVFKCSEGDIFIDWLTHGHYFDLFRDLLRYCIFVPQTKERSNWAVYS